MIYATFLDILQQICKREVENGDKQAQNEGGEDYFIATIYISENISKGKIKIVHTVSKTKKKLKWSETL